LNDEYIAHRLGLIPLRYQLIDSLKAVDCQDVFLYQRDCVCYKNCPRCSVEFDLDVSYPVTGDEELFAPRTVTSQDLNSINYQVQPAHFLSQDEQDVAQDEGISIVKIGPGQRLKFKAIARLGISKEHAKWCPVAVATYRFWPIIHINQELVASLSMDQKRELVEVCPDRILEIDEPTGELRAVDNAWDIATYTEDLMYAQQAMKLRKEDDDFVSMTPSTDKFIFTVESTGAMDAEEIVFAALRVMKKKMTQLAQELESLKDM
jgi:DNA-directed RNA polymerase II subunit RPB3